jgi:hypothetical protein
MPGSNIVSDAMRMALVLDIEGEEETLAKLQRLNAFSDAINAKAAKAADDIVMRRMEVEGKYDPDIQRDLEIERAIKLTKELNISLKTQDAILADIQAKYEKATASIPQYSGELPGDKMTAEFRKNQKQQEVDFLAQKQRVAKEVERIEEESLSHRERLLRRYEEIRKLGTSGVATRDQVMTLAKAARAEYDMAVANEAKILKAKQDAADKEVKIAQDAAKRRQDAANKETAAINLEMGKRRQAEIDAAIDATQARARAAIEATAAADREANIVRQQAISLMRSYETVVERAAADIAFFNNALEDGTITAHEHARAIESIEARQRSMAGGAGRLGFMVGNLTTGLEDFVTVMSVTGFGMDSFSAATRSASNNIGQAVRGLNTAGAAMLAPIISIGAVLVGAAIPAIYQWVTGVEDATEATKKWNKELERRIKLATMLNEVSIKELESQQESSNIQDMKDPDAIKINMEGVVNEIAKIQAELIKTQKVSEATAIKIYDTMVPQEALTDFNALIKGIQEGYSSVGAPADMLAGFEDNMRKKMDEARSQFIQDAQDMGAERARVEFERKMREIQEDMQAVFYDLPAAARASAGNTADAYWNDFLNVWGSSINDAAIIDRIQDLSEELETLTLADAEGNRERIKEVESLMAKLEEMNERRLEAIEEIRQAEGEAREQSMHLARQQMDDELEALRIQSSRNRLLGEENEAERKIFDLAMRRKEIMESGLSSPADLEGMFNSELEAIAAEYEEKLARMQDVTAQHDSMNQTSAYTQANRIAIEAESKDNTAEKEMIELLKAIKDHLAGKNMLSVEVQ